MPQCAPHLTCQMRGVYLTYLTCLHSDIFLYSVRISLRPAHRWHRLCSKVFYAQICRLQLQSGREWGHGEGTGAAPAICDIEAPRAWTHILTVTAIHPEPSTSLTPSEFESIFQRNLKASIPLWCHTGCLEMPDEVACDVSDRTLSDTSEGAVW